MNTPPYTATLLSLRTSFFSKANFSTPYDRFLAFSNTLFILASLALLFLPREWFPSFYQPVFMGLVALASPLLVFLPKMAVKNDSPKNARMIGRIRAVIMASLLIGGLGELGLYQLYRVGLEYDKLAHFTISMLLTIVYADALMEWKRPTFRTLLWWVVPALLAAGIVWEGLEAASDKMFGTELWGIYGSAVAMDTLWDIYFDSFGVLAGVIAFALRRPARSPKRKMRKQSAAI